MIGRTLGHYHIVEEIGKGGMGVVYRAHDERLDRNVALKVLPAGTLADEAARKRFRKEALALSRLNHPNIETVHDFDTQEGVDFLVMEHIPGITLSDKLAGGPLPEKEIARLGAQLAEGLAAAHAEGVVHRDLKPGNLRVTPDGRLKILDFGLAKLIRPLSATATTESLSETEGRAGTPLYMAPEQQRGEKVDARADIYAAGLVLLQMVTGELPRVRGRALAGKVSPDLERIIGKCLEEDPELRYQSAKELLVDLRRLGAPALPRILSRRAVLVAVAALAALAVLVGLNVGQALDRLARLLGRGGPPRIDSIAVLPLENLSGDPEQEYFADGMTEALITELSQIGALKVISRTSAMQYKGAKKPMPQIAEELGVDALVEGSVLREGDQVRITVQLIHGPTDRHLWADSYQRELRGILALQSEVARAIADEIEVKLTSQQQAQLAGARPVDPEAYQFYLKGRYYWNKRTGEGVKKALEYFQQAIEKDPTYALAYTGVADCYNASAGGYLGLPSREAYPRARAAALKALALDDTLAEAHISLADTKLVYEWDWMAAEGEFRRGLELNPGYATGHQWYAEYLRSMGRQEEGLLEVKRALELDPFSLVINVSLGRGYIYARQYDRAIEQCRKTVEMEPQFPYAHACVMLASLLVGRGADAASEMQELAELRGAKPEQVAAIREAYERAGIKGLWRLDVETLSEQAKREYVTPTRFAEAYAQLGEKDQAMAWLEKAYEERDGWMTDVKTWPLYDPLRDDPRFQNLLRRMNFPKN